MVSDGFRKVLIIAYYFPPMGLSGVQRTAKFAKYLSKYGWKPTVLTVEPAGYYAFDETLLKEVEEAGVRIVRTRSYDVNHLFKKNSLVKMPSDSLRKIFQFLGDTFFIPDTKIGWKSKAVNIASKLHKEENFDLIFATAPPQTDFLIGAALKRKFDIPLIVDYRDAWLDYPFKFFPTPLHKFWHKYLEKRVLKAADRVVVTHRRVKESILRRFPFISYNEVSIVSQGFDPEDFATVIDDRHNRPMHLRITHSGTFYANRNPKIFLQALANVLHSNPKMRGRIEVYFIGNVRKEDKKLVKRLDLQNVINFIGYLPHRECVKNIMESDLLWFVIDNDYQTPGKLYEYFGSRKPLLASLVDGYTKQLIEDSAAASCVPINDIKAHEKAMYELFNKFEQKKMEHMPSIFAAKFDRLMLTGELAKLFESLMNYDHTNFITIKERSE